MAICIIDNQVLLPTYNYQGKGLMSAILMI
ncbi:hypothetical protein NIES4102_21970 [Chondrocystis sp. NIES-4102]|nr:hypothetical protein NIES4102_21970 [Chondrocystis sp. NIES-4102]